MHCGDKKFIINLRLPIPCFKTISWSWKLLFLPFTIIPFVLWIAFHLSFPLTSQRTLQNFMLLMSFTTFFVRGNRIRFWNYKSTGLWPLYTIGSPTCNTRSYQTFTGDIEEMEIFHIIALLLSPCNCNLHFTRCIFMSFKFHYRIAKCHPVHIFLLSRLTIYINLFFHFFQFILTKQSRANFFNFAQIECWKFSFQVVMGEKISINRFKCGVKG